MTKPLRTWWHELNTWEPDAARAFYGRTLGWEFEKVALPDAAEYWIARKEGKPVGGVFALSEPDYAGIPSHWMTYMAVADIGQQLITIHLAHFVPGAHLFAHVGDSGCGIFIDEDVGAARRDPCSPPVPVPSSGLAAFATIGS